MMKSQKVFSLLLVIMIVAMLLPACSKQPKTGGEDPEKTTNNASESKSPTQDGEVRVIGFSFNNLDEAMVKTKEYVEEWDANHPEIEVLITSAEARLDKQISDCEAFIAQRVDMLVVICLDVDGCAPIVDLAHAAGIPCTSFYDEINHEDLDLFVGESPYDVGVVQAETIKKFLEENPEVTFYAGHILGDLMYAEVQKTKDGLMDGLAEEIENGRVVILDEKTGEWASTKAMNVTEDWLQAFPQMNCIIGMSDEMALGALQALNAAGKTMGEDCYLFGKDGSARGIEEVRAGQMTGTVLIDYNAGTRLKMNNILDFMNGKDMPYNASPASEDIYVPVLLSNVEEAMAEHPQ